MKVWVSRDKDTDSLVTLWDNTSGKISLNNDGRFIGSGGLFCYEKDAFKDEFGFTPRKGSCKQYNLTLERIEE